VGAVAFVHGVDQAFAGASTLYSGSSAQTYTNQALQYGGVPAEYAGYADAAIGVASGVGAGRYALGLGVGFTESSSVTSLGAARADFEVFPGGTAIPTSRSRLEAGFRSAGFEARPSVGTAELGTIYTDPTSGLRYRVMAGSATNPARLVTHAPKGPNPLLPDGSNIPAGLTRQQIRDLIHFQLDP
jgi:hypothetical protein